MLAQRKCARIVVFQLTLLKLAKLTHRDSPDADLPPLMAPTRLCESKFTVLNPAFDGSTHDGNLHTQTLDTNSFIDSHTAIRTQGEIMLVVVADDKPEMLLFVQTWFDRHFANDRNIRLATHAKLDDLEQFIASRLEQNDKFLLLLDLNWEADKTRTLRWISRIKRASATRHWPILIYSESNDEIDVRDAHKAFANGYVNKGDDEQEENFINVLEHWRTKQMLPIG
jgi:CheY-like chemotaxis protein